MNASARLDSAAREAVERRFARGIVAALDRSALAAPADVGERLRFARERALTRARESRGDGPDRLGTTASGAAILGFARSAWWFRVATWLPLVVLVAGLIVIEEQSTREQISAAAAVDTELLGDDLPISAYRDAGFLEFLKSPPSE
jgi:hypothetical protein